MAKQPTLFFTPEVDMMDDKGAKTESVDDATKGPQPLIKRQRRRAPPKLKEVVVCVNDDSDTEKLKCGGVSLKSP